VACHPPSCQPNFGFESELCRFVTAAVKPNRLRLRESITLGLALTLPNGWPIQGGGVTSNKSNSDEIPGTIIFDGEKAMKGYALNRMCFSFNSADNREAYRRDEGTYCDKFNLTEQQRQALRHRNVLELLEAGGNIYYLAKWAGIFGMNVQQMGAQQRGLSEDEFKELLVRAGGD
jgi:protocatechuate 4,5-dioxygenase alpha chain